MTKLVISRADVSSKAVTPMKIDQKLSMIKIAIANDSDHIGILAIAVVVVVVERSLAGCC